MEPLPELRGGQQDCRAGLAVPVGATADEASHRAPLLYGALEQEGRGRGAFAQLPPEFVARADPPMLPGRRGGFGEAPGRWAPAGRGGRPQRPGTEHGVVGGVGAPEGQAQGLCEGDGEDRVARHAPAEDEPVPRRPRCAERPEVCQGQIRDDSLDGAVPRRRVRGMAPEVVLGDGV